MEGEEGIASADASTVADGPGPNTNPNPSPPPHDDRGSDPADEAAEPEIHSPVSDEDQDHDHEQDQDHDPDHDHDHVHAAETGVSTDDLKLRIIKQAWLVLLEALYCFQEIALCFLCGIGFALFDSAE